MAERGVDKENYGFGQAALDVLRGNLDIPASLGSGILRGGASLLDLIRSLTTANSRERDPNQTLLEHIAGYTPLQSLYSESGLEYEPRTTLGRYAKSVGEFVPGGAIGKAPKAIKAAGILSGGIGSEGLGELSKRVLGEWSEPYARIAGGLVSPIVGTRLANRATIPTIGNENVINPVIGRPQTIQPPESLRIPENLSTGQQAQIKVMAGNKAFEKPLMDYARRAEEAQKKSQLSVVKDIRKDLTELKSSPKQSLENNPIDTKDLVSSLKNERSIYQQIGDSPTLDRTKYLDEIAKQSENLTVKGVNALRQDIGQEIGKKAGAAEAYRIVSDFLEQKVPNYRSVIGRNDLSRQASIVSKEFEKALARNKGKIDTAIKQADRNIGNKITNKEIDINRLVDSNVPGAQKLEGILNKLEDYSPNPPILTQDTIQEALGRSSVGGKSAATGDLFNKSLTSRLFDFAVDVARPNPQQIALQQMVPGAFGSLGNEALRGGFSSSTMTNAGRNALSQFFPQRLQQSIPQFSGTETSEEYNQNPFASVREKYLSPQKTSERKQDQQADNPDSNPFSAIRKKYTGR